MMCVRNTIVTMPQNFEDRVQSWFDKYLNKIARSPTFEIHDFLLPPSSSYWQDKCVGDVNMQGANPECEWVSEHKAMFERFNIARPSTYNLQDFAKNCPIAVHGKWLLSRPMREQEMAYFWSMRIKKEDKEAFVDVSQGITRVTPMRDLMNCFTSETLLWMAKARRFVSGREMLAVQGMGLYSQVEHDTDDLLGNMAGNAFSAPCCMAATLAALACASE